MIGLVVERGFFEAVRYNVGLEVVGGVGVEGWVDVVEFVFG